MAKALSVQRRASHETVVHDYSGPERSNLIGSRRTADPLQRRQIVHFDRDIRAGDHIVLGYDPFQAETFLIAVNIRHPDGVKGIWWATLEPIGPPDVTVAGKTFSSRLLALSGLRGRRRDLP